MFSHIAMLTGQDKPMLNKQRNVDRWRHSEIDSTLDTSIMIDEEYNEVNYRTSSDILNH